jgi:hypothetical protein
VRSESGPVAVDAFGSRGPGRFDVRTFDLLRDQLALVLRVGTRQRLVEEAPRCLVRACPGLQMREDCGRGLAVGQSLRLPYGFHDRDCREWPIPV